MRRFEYREGSSSKFWTVEVRGKTVKTTWGRIGAAAQSKAETLASATAAVVAADRQAEAKRRKGYVEVRAGATSAPVRGGSAKTTVATSTKTTSAKAAPTEAAPAMTATARTSTGKFAFTAEYDAKFRLGYPHMRRRAPALGKGVEKMVNEELADIDPFFRVDVPEDVARAFLSAMAHDRKDKAARAAAIKQPAEVDGALLDAVLKRLCPALVTEVYQFRILDAVWLFEAFLGTEAVAEALVARFVEVVGKPKLWTQTDNAHDHAFHFANALGFMRLRMSPARWAAITKPLASVKSRLLFGERLRLLVDPKRPVPTHNDLDMHRYEIALQRGLAKPLQEYAKKWGGYWHTPRFYFVGGVRLLDSTDLSTILRAPAWQQKRVVEEFGRIKTMRVVLLIAIIASGRAASKEAAAWLQEHADYARPILKKITAPKVKPAADAALALIGKGGGGSTKGDAARAASTKPLTPAQVTKAVRKLMAVIGKGLPAAKGDRARELAILKDAFQEYCEVRAAGGDPIPEAYFTHQMIDIDWKKQPSDDVQRWFELAVEAAS